MSISKRSYFNFLEFWRSPYFDYRFTNSSCRLGSIIAAWSYQLSSKNWCGAVSPFFDTRYYHDASPDARSAGWEPISHYIKYGFRELRSPSRYFDAKGFAEAHPLFMEVPTDLAQVCLRLYGSYAWKVDGRILPSDAKSLTLASKPFTRKQRQRLFTRWRLYNRFFDADFYIKEYPEVASTREEAFAHYMHLGFSEDRKPRPDFDGYRYRKTHDLHRGQNPFRHCIDRMGFESRFQGNLESLPLPAQISDMDISDLKLSIHLHCYYVDILEEILVELENITLPFSLIVTVCSDTDAKTVMRRVTSLRSKSHVDIHVLVTRNRGRDIAPFIIDASDLWKNADVVLHIHTKKSPHVSWGDNWRRYLIRSTIGSDLRVRQIIDRFQNDPCLGLVYPENYDLIKHFTEQEQNDAAISFVAAKLDLKSDYLAAKEYPAGSVAYYRVSALSKILKIRDLESIFEKEDGQLDGTSAHALERLLPEIVRQSGFKEIAYFAE